MFELKVKVDLDGSAESQLLEFQPISKTSKLSLYFWRSQSSVSYRSKNALFLRDQLHVNHVQM